MIDKLQKRIRQILLNNTIYKYKTRNDTLKNLKNLSLSPSLLVLLTNFGLLDKQLKDGGTNLSIEYNDEKCIFIL
jgi:hypothetical protein